MKTPAHLAPKGRGRAFWKEITSAFELTPDEVEVLAESCTTLDTLENLRKVIAKDGSTTKGSRGQTVVHPALAEHRQQQVVLSRLLRQLGIPKATQILSAGGVPSITSARARRAARARWGDAS